ncbi:hypothetical protein ACKVMT_08140 [Halobacteriales archaeon Cl-PHB]
MIDGKTPLAFEPLADRPGLEVVDRLEQQRYRLHTPEAVSPDLVDPTAFHFPVGRAVAFETSDLVLPNVVSVIVRDAAGDMVAEVEHLDAVSLPPDSYVFELSTQIKSYVEVTGAVDITADLAEVQFDFGATASVRLGARSRHERPAATITTTDDPVDVMAAVETFGSALKTTDPERSYPTLRGHPPAIERGETLAIPDGIDRPDTDVRLELPPRLDAVYTASPLAYYLGAAVEPGSTPRLVTDSGFEHSFETPQGFEDEVARVLQQVFFFDCLTRTEGLYTIDLHERNAVDPYVDLDFASLYEQSIGEQVAAYLQVPFDLVEEYVPQWRLTAHVEPSPGTVEQLPFVVDDLAIVRTESPGTTGDTDDRRAIPQTQDDDLLTRSAGGASRQPDVSYVEPAPRDTLEQAWIGDGIPIGASKLTTDAFQNRLNRDLSHDEIQITIVLNDSRMAEERDLVDEVYGDREELPFEVSVFRNTTVAELRDILRDRSGFLHYIGHTEADGFECSDGKLDADDLAQTGIEAFLLNACNSYRQGLKLIEAGAIAGIVTLNDIINDGAVRIGETTARLLNAGFPLRASLTIAREQSVQGGQYIVVGDGGMTVGQPSGGQPNILDVTRSGDRFEVTITSYVMDDKGLGSIFRPLIDDVTEFYLVGGVVDSFEFSTAELAAFLDLEQVPVRIEDELFWSQAVSIPDL